MGVSACHTSPLVVSFCSSSCSGSLHHLLSHRTVSLFHFVQFFCSWGELVPSSQVTSSYKGTYKWIKRMIEVKAIMWVQAVLTWQKSNEYLKVQNWFIWPSTRCMLGTDPVLPWLPLSMNNAGVNFFHIFLQHSDIVQVCDRLTHSVSSHGYLVCTSLQVVNRISAPELFIEACILKYDKWEQWDLSGGCAGWHSDFGLAEQLACSLRRALNVKHFELQLID